MINLFHQHQWSPLQLNPPLRSNHLQSQTFVSCRFASRPAGAPCWPQTFLSRRMHSSDTLRCFDTSPLTKQKNTKDLWTPSQPNKLLQIGLAATIGPKPLVNGHMLSPIVAVKIFMVQLVEVILGNLKVEANASYSRCQGKKWGSTFTSILPSNWLEDLAPKSTYYSIW